MSTYSPPGQPAPHDRPWLFLSVPRDADPRLLKAAVSQLPGCDSVAVGEVASKGQLSASFEHPRSARCAADAIAADSKARAPQTCLRPARALPSRTCS